MNRVYLVGAGCGEGMLTLRGAKLVGECDCLVYDSLIDENILRLAKPSCLKIPVGKRAGAHSEPQEKINGILVGCGRKYPLTVRLKGGDPFVFGRGGEELLALKNAGICAESVPGVSSCIAAAEFFGVPVTHRGVSRGFHVVTAHTSEGAPDFSRLAKEEDTLVFLMAKGSAEKIVSGLIGGGMPPETPAAIFSEAGFSEGSAAFCTLCRVAREAEKLPAPLVVAVGNVCAFGTADKADAAAGGNRRRAVVTGTRAHVSRVLPGMRAAGFAAEGLCHLDIKPADFDGFFGRLSGFDMLVFTSANGVRVFFGRAREKGVDLRAFGGKKFAVIGNATGEELQKYGFYADVMPKRYDSAALAAELRRSGIPAQRTALLRSAEGNRVLNGCGEQVSLYGCVPDEGALARAESVLQGADIVTFSSAGGVRALLSRVSLPETASTVAIGEETARALKGFGFSPSVADSACAESLVQAAAAAKESVCRD